MSLKRTELFVTVGLKVIFPRWIFYAHFAETNINGNYVQYLKYHVPMKYFRWRFAPLSC
jgi:hypothetical protein